MQWHQLDHTQTTCTSVQTDNHNNTASLNFLQAMQVLFPSPNQQYVKALKAKGQLSQ